MRQPSVAAIVLNYNAKELTLQSVESLLGMTYPDFRLIVVDNGSSDGSHEAVIERFPEVEAIRVDPNRGPAGGLNAGLEHALPAGDDYLLVLNNDIEVHPEMLTELVAAAEADPKAACVGPKAYYYDHREIIWSAGGVLRFKESVTRERGEGERDRGQYDETGEVDYVNGCAMLMRASVVREIGLFDPIFHLAVEDADWCMRAKRRGYRCLFAHRAVLWHMVSMSTGVYTPGRTFQTGRSSALFVRRYAGPWQWLTFFAFLAAALPLAWLRELVRGNQAAAVAKLRGVMAGLRAPMSAPPPAPPSPPGPPPALPRGADARA